MLASGVVIYSQIWWADVILGVLFDGGIAAIWLTSATLLGNVITRRLQIPPLLQFTSAAALGLGFFSLAILGLGLAGLLNFATSVGLLIVSAATGLLDVFLSRKPAPPRIPD